MSEKYLVEKSVIKGTAIIYSFIIDVAHMSRIEIKILVQRLYAPKQTCFAGEQKIYYSAKNCQLQILICDVTERMNTSYFSITFRRMRARACV